MNLNIYKSDIYQKNYYLGLLILILVDYLIGLSLKSKSI